MNDVKRSCVKDVWDFCTIFVTFYNLKLLQDKMFIRHIDILLKYVDAVSIPLFIEHSLIICVLPSLLFWLGALLHVVVLCGFTTSWSSLDSQISGDGLLCSYKN